jgi:hypothetical protein
VDFSGEAAASCGLISILRKRTKGGGAEQSSFSCGMLFFSHHFLLYHCVQHSIMSDREESKKHKKKDHKRDRVRDSDSDRDRDRDRHRQRDRDKHRDRYRDRDSDRERHEHKSSSKKHKKDSEKDSRHSHKKHKDKSKDKDRGHRHNKKEDSKHGEASADITPITEDDYFLKNEEFRVWLHVTKDISFETLTTVQARELFSEKFCKVWDKGSLPPMYYDGTIPTELRQQCAKTSHKWGFKLSENEKEQVSDLGKQLML